MAQTSNRQQQRHPRRRGMTRYQKLLKMNNSKIYAYQCIIHGNDNDIIGDENTVVGVRNRCRGKDNFLDTESSNINVEVNTNPQPSSEEIPRVEDFLRSFITTNFPVATISRSSIHNDLSTALQLSVATEQPVRRRPETATERKNLDRAQRTNKRLKPSEDTTAESEKVECVICYTNKPCTIFIPCNHFCCCATCASKCDICPVCNRPHKGVQQIVSAGRVTKRQKVSKN